MGGVGLQVPPNITFYKVDNELHSCYRKTFYQKEVGERISILSEVG